MRQQDLDLMIALLRPKVAPAGDDAPPQDLRIPAWAMQRGHYEDLGAKGDETATAILRLAPTDWMKASAAFLAGLQQQGVRIASGPDGGIIVCPSLAILDAIALQALDEARAGDAALLLALKLAIAPTAADEADALCSLSHCAASQGQFADALVLARACLALSPTHPRAHCIAGLCQLQGGNRKQAQSALALAARIARTNPDYAELLQAAQRLLLILHLEP